MSSKVFYASGVAQRRGVWNGEPRWRFFILEVAGRGNLLNEISRVS
jgi:hypothetical protein